MKLQPVIFNMLRIISVNLDTYWLTARVCTVGMYAWQHTSSADLAAAATTNLRVKHFNLNVSSEDSHCQLSAKCLVLS